MEEFQEADVLWPWPDTPPPSPEEDEEGSYDAAIAFSCEPFSEPAAASWSASSTTSSTSLSAVLLSSDDWSDDGGGFFLSGPSTVSSAARLELDATEEFLEADVLWPDTAGAADDAAEFLWWRRRSRRVEEAEAAASAVFCGKREAGCSSGPLVASSPIDIPVGREPVMARIAVALPVGSTRSARFDRCARFRL